MTWLNHGNGSVKSEDLKRYSRLFFSLVQTVWFSKHSLVDVGGKKAACSPCLCWRRETYIARDRDHEDHRRTRSNCPLVTWGYHGTKKLRFARPHPNSPKVRQDLPIYPAFQTVSRARGRYMIGNRPHGGNDTCEATDVACVTRIRTGYCCKPMVMSSVPRDLNKDQYSDRVWSCSPWIWCHKNLSITRALEPKIVWGSYHHVLLHAELLVTQHFVLVEPRLAHQSAASKKIEEWRCVWT
jgi:hypothetical protein